MNVQLEQPVPIWSLSEILAYLDRYEATILYTSDKGLAVKFPESPDRELITSAVLPHLKARKPEIERYLRESYPGLFQTETAVEARKRIIREVRTRAAESGKRMFYLARNGACVGDDAKPLRKTYSTPRKRKVNIPIVRSATHVCVEGGEWVSLPNVLTSEEAAEFEKGKTAKRAQGRRWNFPQRTLYEEG